MMGWKKKKKKKKRKRKEGGRVDKPSRCRVGRIEGGSENRGV